MNNNCLNCNTETKNPKYCCRSCSAIVNGKLFPKRKIERKCTQCDQLVKHHQTTLCEKHLNQRKRSTSEFYKTKTVGEYRNKLSVKGKHPSWINAHVRTFARIWLKDLRNLPCAKCGYNKHVELAHIKSVASFSDDTLLSIINSKENVVQLCPNCHWEFDNLPRQ